MNDTTLPNNSFNAISESDLSGYNAVRAEGAGIINLSSRGRIRVSGSEAVMFLNGLITNDMKTLGVNSWMPAAFPNVQGRLIAFVRVIRLADETEKSPRFLLDTEHATHQAVLTTIQRFTMAGDFRVEDITSETGMVSLQGRRSADLMTQVLGGSLANLPRDGVTDTSFGQGHVTILRASHTAEDGFDFVLDSLDAGELTQVFLNAGAVLVNDAALEALRIESGIGSFGRDMDEQNVVTEANLDEAVSFTKGCYIGQEIIARIKYRGHVAKKLTGIEFEDSNGASVGAIIKSIEGKDIGRVTSATFSPNLNKVIALGYVRYEYLAPGTVVMVDDSEAKVSALPFIRGSWFVSK